MSMETAATIQRARAEGFVAGKLAQKAEMVVLLDQIAQRPDVLEAVKACSASQKGIHAMLTAGGIEFENEVTTALERHRLKEGTRA
jgi:hypothetical protein